MKRCGAVHPVVTDLVCVLPEGPHLSHASGINTLWDNMEAIAAYQKRPTKSSGKGKPSRATLDRLKRLEDSTASERHASDVPVEAARAWSKSRWTQETTAILKEFLAANPDKDWTSPEDFWPLITSPQGDMRAMSMVIQFALRQGWIREVGAKRLRDTYITRDGVRFRINKLVPLYTSNLS